LTATAGGWLRARQCAVPPGVGATAPRAPARATPAGLRAEAARPATRPHPARGCGSHHLLRRRQGTARDRHAILEAVIRFPLLTRHPLRVFEQVYHPLLVARQAAPAAHRAKEAVPRAGLPGPPIRLETGLAQRRHIGALPAIDAQVRPIVGGEDEPVPHLRVRRLPAAVATRDVDGHA